MATTMRPRPRSGRTLLIRLALLLALPAGLSGCVERLLFVRTEPPGADVHINGQAAGVTPLTHPFGFYGTVAIVVRREGYLSQRLVVDLEPPWYDFFPIDFIAHFLVPWTLEAHHEVTATLEAVPPLDARGRRELQERAAEARRLAQEDVE
jgi:hypothetical protein